MLEEYPDLSAYVALGVIATGSRVMDLPAVRVRIGVQQIPDHFLIRRLVLARFPLEEIDAGLAERDRHLHRLVPERECFRRRKKILDPPAWLHRLIAVPGFPVHRFSCPCARTRRQ